MRYLEVSPKARLAFWAQRLRIDDADSKHILDWDFEIFQAHKMQNKVHKWERDQFQFFQANQ